MCLTSPFNKKHEPWGFTGLQWRWCHSVKSVEEKGLSIHGVSSKKEEQIDAIYLLFFFSFPGESLYDTWMGREWPPKGCEVIAMAWSSHSSRLRLHRMYFEDKEKLHKKKQSERESKGLQFHIKMIHFRLIFFLFPHKFCQAKKRLEEKGKKKWWWPTNVVWQRWALQISF